MKPNEALKCFGEISDRYITAADVPAAAKKTGNGKKIIGIAACIALLITGAFVLQNVNKKPSVKPGTDAPDGQKVISSTAPVSENFSPDTAIAAPVLKQYPPYPDFERFFDPNGGYDNAAYMSALAQWETAKKENKSIEENYRSSLTSFTEKSIKEFVVKNADKNCVFSPVNVYLALAMTAELTAGETRTQILSLLDTPDIERLRQNAKNLFDKTYFDDGAYICVPGASVWLNEAVNYKQESLQTLANVYRAYSFSGKPGAPEYDAALHNWLNFVTGGLLKDSADSLKMTPDTLMTLVTSLYLSAKWQNEFQKTETGVFYSPTGELVRDFMLNNEQSMLYSGSNFSAVSIPIAGGGCMWIILPDEDSSVDAVLSDSDFYSFIKDPMAWENRKSCYIKMRLPKFDVTSDVDLKEGLERLGVTKIFSSDQSDFTNLTDMSEVFVNKVQHSARVKTDEQGITAAAFTVIELSGASIPANEIDFIVDHPFIFTVTGGDNAAVNEYSSVLFCGVVNEP